MDSDRGPVTAAVDGWTVHVQHGLPAAYGAYRRHAVLCEESGLGGDDGDCWFVAASAAGDPWPRLVIAQRYSPAGCGFSPGLALVPQTAVLFAGAGSRLLAYTLRDRPRRLWEDSTGPGFWHWSVHGPAVLMAAELEFAAWNLHGVKLWSMFVELPDDRRAGPAGRHGGQEAVPRHIRARPPAFSIRVIAATMLRSAHPPICR